LKAVLTITAVVLGVLGGGLLAAPRGMAVLYGAAVSTGGTNAARTAGAAIFALAMLAWPSRGESQGASNVLGGRVLFVWFVLKSVVAYLAVVSAAFDRSRGGDDSVLRSVTGSHLWLLRGELGAHCARTTRIGLD